MKVASRFRGILLGILNRQWNRLQNLRAINLRVWMKKNWHHEKGWRRSLARLVKVAWEGPTIAICPTILTVPVLYLTAQTTATPLKQLQLLVPTFSGSFALFFHKMWCFQLSEEDRQAIQKERGKNNQKTDSNSNGDAAKDITP